MSSRSHSRQLAVQILYQKQFSGYELDRVLALFWRDGKNEDTVTRQFTEDLVHGVTDHLESLDLEISGYLKNWTLDRIVAIDRIILQLAFFEFIHQDGIPWRVVIDEAVRLGKQFSSEKSALFINGVLHAWATQNLETGEAEKPANKPPEP